MNQSGKPILDNRRTIIAGLPSESNTMLASVFDSGSIDIAQLASAREEAPIQAIVPEVQDEPKV